MPLCKAGRPRGDPYAENGVATNTSSCLFDDYRRYFDVRLSDCWQRFVRGCVCP